MMYKQACNSDGAIESDVVKQKHRWLGEIADNTAGGFMRKMCQRLLVTIYFVFVAVAQSFSAI